MISKNYKEIAVLSTFPPRACGIATYSTDLIDTIVEKFHTSYHFQRIPIILENDPIIASIPQNKIILQPNKASSFDDLASYLNDPTTVDIVFIQHEFGFFYQYEDLFLTFLSQLKKKVIITFHTVLPTPDANLKTYVAAIAGYCSKIIVMTQYSADILRDTYHIQDDKIVIIAHGTHLAPAIDKALIRERYKLVGKKVLCTFGLLGPGKSLETTIVALPSIIAETPNVIFLILGMTHPNLIAEQGESYRMGLEQLVLDMNLTNHVRFINQYLPTADLLAYLQITDVYLFTSNDPFQAVSGTFAYALGLGCPIVSTPIPHVLETLTPAMGIIIDFNAPDQLAVAVNTILSDAEALEKIRKVNLQQSISNSWHNIAIAHAQLFGTLMETDSLTVYTIPKIKLDHLERMTTDIGIIQFAEIAEPKMSSGYALDDNARALIAILHNYNSYKAAKDLEKIKVYFRFIMMCQQEDGTFLNYVDKDRNFTEQNKRENLEDANGRAFWAIGELLAQKDSLPDELVVQAQAVLRSASRHLLTQYSTRAMAFKIKGLHALGVYPYDKEMNELAHRLLSMFSKVSTDNWQWFEPALTYGNAALPEAMLCAYEATGNYAFKEVAYLSFDFLLKQTFYDDMLHVIPNDGWAEHDKPFIDSAGDEQPIDVAYTVIALDRFYNSSLNWAYREILISSFAWFLGKNHLHQIVYNSITGGCFDGLKQQTVNLNQGAESTVSYLLARMVVDKYTVDS